MRWIFWGTLWQALSLNLNIDGLQFRILPLFLCYLLVMHGCTQLTEESERFRTCRTVYFGITLCMLAVEVGALFSMTAEIWSTWIAVAAQCGQYLYIRGMQDTEGRYGDLGGAALMTTWKVATVCTLLAYPISLLQMDSLPGILYFVVTVCAHIWFLVLLYRAWKTYETRHRQVYGMDDDAWNKESDLP